MTYKMDPSWRNATENATLKAKANAAKNSTGTGAKDKPAPATSSLLQLNAEISLEQLSQDKLNI